MRQGFTLIETIVYMGLLSTLIGGALLIAYQLMESTAWNENHTTLIHEVEFVMQKIDWALTGVSAINTPAIGTSGTMLSLTKSNFGENPIVFDVALGSLQISRESAPPLPLTSDNVVVSSFTVEHGAAPETITVNMTINGEEFSRTRFVRQ